MGGWWVWHEGWEEGSQGPEDTFRDDGCARHLDGGDSFMGVSTGQNLSYCVLSVCVKNPSIELFLKN